MDAYFEKDTYLENRREALLNTITEMGTRYSALPNANEPQLPTLHATTTRLKKFAEDILNFFNNGFTSGKLQSVAFPPNNVYSVLLNQISFDMEVIQRAADQRITSGFPVMKQRLKEADNLAWQALQKAVGTNKPLEPGTTVVTYFQKSPMARVIPYANVALIGIPYTSVDEPRDLLATPHEVGHYVFWHARDTVPPQDGEGYYLYRSLIKQAVDELKALITFGHPELDTWCYVWLEELFSDVYGGWVAGPVFALTLQDMLANRAMGEFRKSDGDHPVPVLRPFTAMKVFGFQRIGSSVLDLLQEHWQTTLTSYQNPSDFTTPEGSDVALQEAIKADSTLDPNKPVDRLVNLVLNRLNDFGVSAGDLRSSPSSAPATVDDIYAQFEAFRQGNLSELQIISQQEDELSGPASFTEWATTRFDLSQDLRNLIADPNYRPAQPISETEWLPIMKARGWTTEISEKAWP
jgi:hypothetical protein